MSVHNRLRRLEERVPSDGCPRCAKPPRTDGTLCPRHKIQAAFGQILSDPAMFAAAKAQAARREQR
jgi:hypothetical protein